MVAFVRNIRKCTDHWYIIPGVLDEVAIKLARPGSMIHYHKHDGRCNERCKGVIINDNAITVDGTRQGGKL